MNVQDYFSVTHLAKTGYVGLLRRIAWVARAAGISRWLELNHDRDRIYHWASSLLSIHDIDGLIALDVPWWTYDAIEEVESFLSSRRASVFEYGSGASTVWLAKRAAKVISVEHDADWYALVSERVAPKDELCPVDLRLVRATMVGHDPPSDQIYTSQKPQARGLAFEAYANEVERAGGPFDLIVIDGRAREACLQHAIPYLAEGGLIVFDNSHRARYRVAIDKTGLKAVRLAGLTPSLPYPDETTLLTVRPLDA
jgi:hypothetical protein